jgi:hypothetical protein
LPGIKRLFQSIPRLIELEDIARTKKEHYSPVDGAIAWLPNGRARV